MPTNYKGYYFTFQLIQNILCFASGLINALCIFDMGMTVSHQSGNTSHTGRLIMIPGVAQLLICFSTTRQVRVVRFLCQLARLLLLLLFLRRTSTAYSRLQCSPPDVIRELRIKVFLARPQPRAPDERSPPDPNHKESPKIYQIECQKECQNICQKVCKNRCQIECQTEWQSICQKECQIECQNKYAI